MTNGNWELQQFLGGYFHQDWTLDHATAGDAVRAFIAESTADERSVVASQLEDFLSLSDGALAAAIFELGAYYDPTADGQTPRAWVRSLVLTLRPSAVPDRR